MINDQESIASQLAEITATSYDGEHLLLMENVTIVVSQMQGGITDPRAASAYLQVGQWGVSHPCSVHPDCILGSHVTDAPVSDPPVKVVPITEAEEDQLVKRASRPSLASLYKRARSTGLVSPSPSGYF